MLSYALATLPPDTSGSDSEKKLYDSKGFGFIRPRETPIAIQYEKYGGASDAIIKKITDVWEKYNLSAQMLVAADIWFRGNGSPDVFTPDLFGEKNIHFIRMSATSFGEKKSWDKDSLRSLATYATFLRENVYPKSSVIEVVSDISEEENYQFEYEDENEN